MNISDRYNFNSERCDQICLNVLDNVISKNNDLGESVLYKYYYLLFYNLGT